MHLAWHMYLADKAYIGSDLKSVKRRKKYTSNMTIKLNRLNKEN